jgi:hypothetical protein
VRRGWERISWGEDGEVYWRGYILIIEIETAGSGDSDINLEFVRVWGTLFGH